MESNIEPGDILFDTGLSRVSTGRWRKDKCAVWKQVVFKCVSNKPRWSQERDAAACLANEVLVLKELQKMDGALRIIMQLYDVLDLGEESVLVLERGKMDVFEYCASMPEITPSRTQCVLKVFRGMVHSLGKLHALDFVHNDVKPENFVLRDDNDVALIDFGFSFKVDEEEEEHQPFSANARFGTELYLHPNLFTNPSPGFFKNDLFGLGVSLFVLYARTLPFSSQTSSAYRDRVKRSFLNGTWYKHIRMDPQVYQQPKYAEWCDLVSKLCNGHWKQASDETILLHPMFHQCEEERDIRDIFITTVMNS